VDFIENDKFIGMAFEKVIRISQPCAIPLCFKVKIDRWPTVTNRTGQRGFSSLARSDQGHRCLTAKGLVQTGNNVSLNHPCRLKLLILICKEKSILPGSIFSGLAGSAITLQRLFLSDVAHSLSLLVPHLNDGDLVAVGDAASDLLTSGLDFL